ncbi:hypothetical protein TRFO_29587 [Tritrichomonas foetus]|uniref:Uncharacterized protein n=1 Tax=Tritrichomonas foetus TaxID=1144522 RepID=A0A1J4K0Q2_9EUKA|nr:hypothetical protein TRFO_29587 [Tritrichomonas foetus]|eukprot:OHT03077.1 hypothetical protein TRFO_29587 [Tritrichomonas foetus]
MFYSSENFINKLLKNFINPFKIIDRCIFSIFEKFSKSEIAKISCMFVFLLAGIFSRNVCNTFSALKQNQQKSTFNRFASELNAKSDKSLHSRDETIFSTTEIKTFALEVINFYRRLSNVHPASLSEITSAQCEIMAKFFDGYYKLSETHSQLPQLNSLQSGSFDGYNANNYFKSHNAQNVLIKKSLHHEYSDISDSEKIDENKVHFLDDYIVVNSSTLFNSFKDFSKMMNNIRYRHFLLNPKISSIGIGFYGNIIVFGYSELQKIDQHPMDYFAFPCGYLNSDKPREIPIDLIEGNLWSFELLPEKLNNIFEVKVSTNKGENVKIKRKKRMSDHIISFMIDQPLVVGEVYQVSIRDKFVFQYSIEIIECDHQKTTEFIEQVPSLPTIKETKHSLPNILEISSETESEIESLIESTQDSDEKETETTYQPDFTENQQSIDENTENEQVSISESIGDTVLPTPKPDLSIYSNFCIGTRLIDCTFAGVDIFVNNDQLISANDISGILNNFTNSTLTGKENPISFFVSHSCRIEMPTELFFKAGVSVIAKDDITVLVTLKGNYLDQTTKNLLQSHSLQNVILNIVGKVAANLNQLELYHVNKGEISGSCLIKATQFNTDFTTLVNFENSNIISFATNISIDGEHDLTDIIYGPSKSVTLTNSGNSINPDYIPMKATVPPSDYVYFLSNRRLTLEASAQLGSESSALIRPTHILFKNNYPDIDFIGIWTVIPKPDLVISIYIGRTLNVAGNYIPSFTVLEWKKENDKWADINMKPETLKEKIFISVVSVVALTIVFTILLCVALGNGKKYKALEPHHSRHISDSGSGDLIGSSG